MPVKYLVLNKQQLIFEDLGIINYKSAWDYQEVLVKKNLDIKSAIRQAEANCTSIDNSTSSYLLFCEHPPVYTLGKSGHIENVLLSEDEMEGKEIEFFRTNRG